MLGELLSALVLGKRRITLDLKSLRCTYVGFEWIGESSAGLGFKTCPVQEDFDDYISEIVER